MLQKPVNVTNRWTTISWHIPLLYLDYILTIPWHIFASTVHMAHALLIGDMKTCRLLWARSCSYCTQLCLNLSFMELQAQNESIIYIHIYIYIWLRSRSDFEQLWSNINFIDLQGDGGLSLYVYLHMHMVDGLLFRHGDPEQYSGVDGILFKLYPNLNFIKLHVQNELP